MLPFELAATERMPSGGPRRCPLTIAEPANQASRPATLSKPSIDRAQRPHGSAAACVPRQFQRRRVSRTVIQHESSNSLVARVAHSPLGARLRSECRPTMASAPPRPSGASPLTDWFAISCVRPSPVTANRPLLHVATSIVGVVTEYHSPSCRGLSELLIR